MTDKVIENNQVTVMGEIVSEFTFSHEIFGEGFYMVDVQVLMDSSVHITVMTSTKTSLFCLFLQEKLILLMK